MAVINRMKISVIIVIMCTLSNSHGITREELISQGGTVVNKITTRAFNGVVSVISVLVDGSVLVSTKFSEQWFSALDYLKGVEDCVQEDNINIYAHHPSCINKKTISLNGMRIEDFMYWLYLSDKRQKIIGITDYCRTYWIDILNAKNIFGERFDFGH